MATNHIGFTGTRKGLNTRQLDYIELILAVSHPDRAVLHHGDCVGADEQVHGLCIKMGVSVIIHPPVNDKHRAFCEGALEIRESKPYLIRNEDIVDESSLIVAAPKGEIEETRSGTWSTLRYAVKRGHPTILLTPTRTVIK